MSAGVVSSTLAVTPTERIKTALIDDAQGPKRFKSTMHGVRLLMAEKGPKALYQGYITTTVKQMGTTTVRLGSYNIIKEFEEARDIPQVTATNFANGAFAGTITVYTTQPIDTVSRSQAYASPYAAAAKLLTPATDQNPGTIRQRRGNSASHSWRMGREWCEGLLERFDHATEQAYGFWRYLIHNIRTGVKYTEDLVEFGEIKW